MKKSQLRNLIRESIKELINEQWTPYIGVDAIPDQTGVDGGYQVNTWKHGMNPAHPSFTAAGSPSGYGEEQPVTYNTPNYNPDTQRIEKPSGNVPGYWQHQSLDKNKAALQSGSCATFVISGWLSACSGGVSPKKFIQLAAVTLYRFIFNSFKFYF